MNIIVDTNIIFSAILTSKGKIRELLINKPVVINFYSPNFLLEELTSHIDKILKITKYNKLEYEQIRDYVIQNINFINTYDIDNSNWDKSYHLLKDIDEKDTAFLALAYQKDALLWTGDKKLVQGLANNRHPEIITTDILYAQYF